MINKLDNPVWNSLNETHENFSINYKGIKFYNPEYCPFGGSVDRENARQGISEYAELSNNLFVVGQKPLVDNSVSIEKELICNQMILERAIQLDLKEEIIHLKDEKQRQELFDLVSLVQPGYFRKKTADLGDYFGIYKENKLVAACGKRMQMHDFTEISAIVTHPNHTGNGYAKQLIKHTTEQIFQENKLPYLHVLESNTHAVGIYERLGFTTRRKMTFWNLVLKGE